VHANVCGGLEEGPNLKRSQLSNRTSVTCATSEDEVGSRIVMHIPEHQLAMYLTESTLLYVE